MLAVYAVPLSMLTASLIGRSVAFAHDPRPPISFVIASLFHIAPWLTANASVERSGRLVVQMVANDYHHRGERNSKLAVKLQGLGLTSLATQQYLKAVAWDPSDHLAYYNLGMLKYFSGREETSLSHFEMFIATVPEHTDTRLVESILAFHQSRFSYSAVLCAAFLLDHPGYAKARYFAKQQQERTDSDRDRQLIQCALLYSNGRQVDAVRACTELVRSTGTDSTVIAFSRKLYSKFREPAPAVLR